MGTVLTALAAVPGTPADAKVAPPHTVGIYSDFGTDAQVGEAVQDGWHLIANVAGLGRSDCHAPYTSSTGSDAHVFRVLNRYFNRHPRAVHPAWLSYWTVDAPPAGLSLKHIRARGRAAGVYAAKETKRVNRNQPVAPNWVVLDPEGYNCGNPQGFDSLNPAQWHAFINGWSDGVWAGGLTAPALYVNQSQYRTNRIADLHQLAVFVAVNPIHGNTPVKGRNIKGYAAYYGDCSSAAADIRTVRSWGKDFNSIQFPGSAICKP